MELSKVREGGGRKCAHHHCSTRRHRGKELRYESAEASLHLVSYHGTPYCSRYSETGHAVRIAGLRDTYYHRLATATSSAAQDELEVRRRSHSRAGRKHADLGREFGAGLGAAGSQNGPAGTRTHAQTEAVRLGALTVVRLESPLAHGSLHVC